MNDYQKAKREALDRRLELLQDAFVRGTQSAAEYWRLRARIAAEHEAAWPEVSTQWEEHLANVAEGKTTL